MNSQSTSTERFKDNAGKIVSTLVIAAGVTALLLGMGNFWIIFAVGFAFIVPLVKQIFGDENPRRYNWRSSKESKTAEDDDSIAEESRNEPLDSLSIIRERYARGELTEEQFERKLDQLLETETLEDVEDRRQAHKLLNEREP